MDRGSRPDRRTPAGGSQPAGRTPFPHRGEHGAAAVEFAIVLPLLVMLILGIMEFSRAFNTKELLQYGVREGARDLALGETTTVAASTIRDRVTTSDPTIDGAQILVAPTPCPAPSSAPAGLMTARVTATYALEYNVPFFSSGFWNLSATGAMRCAG